MHQFCAPRVLAGGRWWSRSQVASRARHWIGHLDRLGLSQSAPVAAVLPTSAEGVALFLAAACRPAPLLLLPPTSAVWPSARPEFAGITLLLPRAVSGLAPAAAALGFRPALLPEPPDEGASGSEPFAIRAPGLVLCTSGSTGEAKPVYRPLATKMAGSVERLRSLGVRDGDGLVTGVPLASGQGGSLLLSALAIGGALGLVGPLDHRAALAALASPDFACWWATPHFADVLGRCALTGPPVVPRVCLISSPISRDVFDRFRARFGVPLRQVYSSTETGPIATEAAPAAGVRPGCVGTPVPGVDIRIGDDPREPMPPGEIGRIWVRTPYAMSGYGVPPHVAPIALVDGWFGTRDLGRLDDQGSLWLQGRVDQCIRTREGRLVNLAQVEGLLRDLPGVPAVAVVPLVEPGGVTFGAVVEQPGAEPGEPARLPLHDLPEWARPRRAVAVPAMPALANGKIDRRTCEAVLAGAVLV